MLNLLTFLISLNISFDTFVALNHLPQLVLLSFDLLHLSGQALFTIINIVLNEPFASL